MHKLPGTSTAAHLPVSRDPRKLLFASEADIQFDQHTLADSEPFEDPLDMPDVFSSLDFYHEYFNR